MREFRLPAVADLAMQLRRGPTRLAPRQLLQIEFLLSVIEPEKTYPFDFIRHALTGFRPVTPTQRPDPPLLSGAALREDLALLAEKISGGANLSADAWTEPLYSVSELSRRFDVSTKTIFRWRQRGLVGWRVRGADGRARVAFADRCVRRFVAEHADLVVRGSSFSQLTPEERAHIIRRAEALAGDGRRSVNAVAREIAQETGRAVETIRVVLRNHDQARPGAGIFNRPRLSVEPDDCRLKVWESYVDGADVAGLAERFGRPIGWVYRTITTMRARELQARRIEFVPSPEFEDAEADATILGDPDLRAEAASEVAPVPEDLAPYLQQLFRIPLLSPRRERALFRAYNYLKFKADRARRLYDPETVRAVELDRIERWLDEAAELKRQITQANLRLVVSIAKRHARRNEDFFEVISDGNVSLMKAVEKFDYTRGYKFSTYATWAVMKNYARSIPEQRHHQERYQTGREDLLRIAPISAADEGENELLPVIRTSLERMLSVLSEREQRILRAHYGLDSQGQGLTLEQIGRQIGVSKERVRQIESRAIMRLRGQFDQEFAALLAR